MRKGRVVLETDGIFASRIEGDDERYILVPRHPVVHNSNSAIPGGELELLLEKPQ